MQDLVIIPTFDRPELLWLCLDYLSASPGSHEVHIRVSVDAHFGQTTPRADIEQVLEHFPHLSIQVMFRHPHQFLGNSFNVLMAYKEAYASNARYVFLIEDDVLIRPDFFAWHRVQHQRYVLGCSIAVVNPGHGAYASLGVCFRREVLKLILPHCRTSYFQSMRLYCKTHFPPSRLDCEQDGLWARVLAGHPIIWATTPMAQHVGWYGYHRVNSIRPSGTLVERYQQVKYTLGNASALREWMRDFGDIIPIKDPCN